MSDDLQGLTGKVSDKYGYVDAQGNYYQRTCFTAGTLIKTRNGYRNIEDVKVGDYVLSWNEKEDQIEYNRVAQTFQRQTNEVYRITLQSGTTIETTWNHPFYIAGRGWVQAKDLRVNDTTSSMKHVNETPATDALSKMNTDKVSAIEISNAQTTVYNFEVEGAHTYFVSNAEILVHNDSCILPDIFRWEDNKGGNKSPAVYDGSVESFDRLVAEAERLNQKGDDIEQDLKDAVSRLKKNPERITDPSVRRKFANQSTFHSARQSCYAISLYTFLRESGANVQGDFQDFWIDSANDGTIQANRSNKGFVFVRGVDKIADKYSTAQQEFVDYNGRSLRTGKVNHKIAATGWGAFQKSNAQIALIRSGSHTFLAVKEEDKIKFVDFYYPKSGSFGNGTSRPSSAPKVWERVVFFEEKQAKQTK